jgi:hypothetical protein
VPNLSEKVKEFTAEQKKKEFSGGQETAAGESLFER